MHRAYHAEPTAPTYMPTTEPNSNSESLRQEVAAVIRAARARRRLSQAQVAAAAGCATRVVSQIETATIDTRFATVVRVAEAVGVVIDLRELAA
jgi:ribosome-binding protein aMBF1 (putative translation factor)